MNALQLIGQQSVEIIPDAIGHRDSLVAAAAAITQVEDELDQHEAAEALKSLKEVAKTVEEGRVAVKAKPLDLTRQIDSIASGFVAPIKSEIERLGAILAAFTRRQREAAEAEERARQAAISEEKRKAAEAERIRKEADAAAQRAVDEAKRKAEAEFLAEDPADAEKAKAEAAAAQAQAEEQARKANEAKAAAEAAEAVRLKSMVTTKAVKPPAMAGLRLQEVWEFEVLDVHALLRDHPNLVDLVPKGGEIKKALKAGSTLSGIRAWKTDRI